MPPTASTLHAAARRTPPSKRDGTKCSDPLVFQYLPALPGWPHVTRATPQVVVNTVHTVTEPQSRSTPGSLSTLRVCPVCRTACLDLEPRNNDPPSWIQRIISRAGGMIMNKVLTKLGAGDSAWELTVFPSWTGVSP
jgi:hypothetical protein